MSESVHVYTVWTKTSLHLVILFDNNLLSSARNSSYVNLNRLTFKTFRYSPGPYELCLTYQSKVIETEKDIHF